MATKKMGVTPYQNEIKASLDDGKAIVDEVVAAESDGLVETSEVLAIVFGHALIELGIWKDHLPFIGKILGFLGK